MTSPKSDAELLSAEQIEECVTDICRDVCELPDRTSPDDWPEACLVEPDELADIARDRINELLAALRSRLTAEAGVRDGALEEAAAAIENDRIMSGSPGPLYSAGYAQGCRWSAVNIRALKSPPAPKGE